MAQLTVRDLSDDVADALKARAARAGRSPKAEHRRILEDALCPAPTAADAVATLRARRIALPPGIPGTTDLLRHDRDRDRDRDRNPV